MFKKNYLTLCFLSGILMLALQVTAQTDTLRLQIESIARSINGHVGVGVLHLDTRDTLTYNGKYHFPMQSVYKFPVALAMLHEIDNGKFKLQQKIHVTKEELRPDTWSPLRDKYPNGNIDITLSEIISVTVSQSDNNGCDILFKLLNGPKEVDNYIHSLGVKEIAIVATEDQMHQSWPVQYENWSTPLAMCLLFNKFYKSEVLTKPNTDFLWKVLVATTTGSKRIKGMLPPHIVVGHKTGTGGKNESGVTSAFNDAGIILLPDGQAIAITIFVSDTPETESTIQSVIAKISKAVYDHYTRK
jgi:beta-lactamase class A